METKYNHRVKYYETDAMKMTHHSNYVRWMEESRIDFMDKLGFSYKKLESFDIASPVLSYTCEIKHSTYFDDIVEIIPKVVAYNSVRLKIQYTMTVNDLLVATGETNHCFVNQKGVPIRLNKDCPELDEKLALCLED